MSPYTPSERPVLFPEPLRESKPGRRLAATLCLCAALGAAAWFLLGDPAVQRWSRDRATVIADRAAHVAPQVAKKFVAAPAPPSAPVAMASVVDSGVDAYEALAYDTSAMLLRRALNARGADSLNAVQRVRALTFLGAAEFQRGKRDSSASAFRQLIVVNPRRPPDPGVFPSVVTDFYDSLRSRQKGVARIASTGNGVSLTVVALTPHEVSIGIGQSGATSFQLFRGVVRDSVVVTWSGLSPQGAAMRPGAYEFVLIASPSEAANRRSVRFPILLERESVTGVLHARAPGAPAASDESRGDAGHLLP